MKAASWTLADILAYSYRKGVTAGALIDAVDSTDGLEGALDARGLGGWRAHATDLRMLAEEQLHLCDTRSVRVVTWWDAEYPARLRTIMHPPAFLFVRGILPRAEAPSIAVVGTRSCSLQYGKPVTQHLVQAWTHRGAAIVSGLATGVDTLAHRACLGHGGCTVAVIASGEDRIAPREARALADDIVAHHGAIVSEYRCGTKAMPAFFPARNRIISGLADSVVVVESKLTGGALITAEFARRNGRTVFAVPGPILSGRSAGTNAMLRDGTARILCSADDVLPAATHPLFLREPVADAYLTALDRQILHHLAVDAVSAETLALLCNTSVVAILGRMLELELMGYVSVLPGQRYTRHG